MERITFEGNFCDISMCRENPCPYNGMCSQRQTWERLKEYEDTGLEPEEIKRIVDAYGRGHTLRTESAERLEIVREIKTDRLRELMQAAQDGRLVELPFVAMVEQSLQDGEMKPMADQKHNGRYAVVYVDHNKWKSPLIDICGNPYNREEAENRMAVLAQKGGEG